MDFQVTAQDPGTRARTGRLTLHRGVVQTPAFLPVGTQATVKGLTPRLLREAGAQMLLANAYHLMLRPGEDLVRSLGGVSAFMGWHGPVLTDSGGYQVFSLADRREVSDEGVRFRSHLDGTEIALTPERAVGVQQALGADVIMALDECPPAGADRAHVAAACARTTRWARRSVAAHGDGAQALFPIVQGGVYADLRRESAAALVDLDAPGYAIGGVSVGEGEAKMREVVDLTAPLLPADRPRYLMGVGRPADLCMAMAAGVDLFDCVLPTRNGRNGQALTARGPVNLRNRVHRGSDLPIDETCDCYACRTFSRGYLRHLFLAGEMLASILTSVHNVRFLIALTERARAAIRSGRFAAFAADAAAGGRAEAG